MESCEPVLPYDRWRHAEYDPKNFKQKLKRSGIQFDLVIERNTESQSRVWPTRKVLLEIV